MIIITGAAGFIGSVMAERLNRARLTDLILVDNFDHGEKLANWTPRDFTEVVDRSVLFDWLSGKEVLVEAIIHLGARTDTASTDTAVFDALNLSYSQRLWQWCVEHSVPLLYASSAATYGNGQHGFSDDPALLPTLKPTNAYARSKQVFDCWALQQPTQPPFWAGFKFFNVYGPNEAHKGRMASVVYHAYHQIQETGRVRLFRSHKPEVSDGHQARDFISVFDVVDCLFWFLTERPNGQCGIYNLGTGQARTFLDLITAVFHATNITPVIEWQDTPLDIQSSYQYFTEADLRRLRATGYTQPFRKLEDGVSEYVNLFLKNNLGL
jgi:ADP-L-glycero-D-manno-heptose 6-epimerase